MFANLIQRIVDWWKKTQERESESAMLYIEMVELMEVDGLYSLRVKMENEQAFLALRNKYLANGWREDEIDQMEISLRSPPTVWPM